VLAVTSHAVPDVLAVGKGDDVEPHCEFVLGGIEQVYEFAKKGLRKPIRERQRLLMLGEPMDMVLHKQQRFGRRLPPEFAAAISRTALNEARALLRRIPGPR
jgi:hypothetical protein